MPVASKGDADSQPRALRARPPATSPRKKRPATGQRQAGTRVAPVSRDVVALPRPPLSAVAPARRGVDPLAAAPSLSGPLLCFAFALLPYVRERDGGCRPWPWGRRRRRQLFPTCARVVAVWWCRAAAIRRVRTWSCSRAYPFDAGE